MQAQVSEIYLQRIKNAVRVDDPIFDDEIRSLIVAARQELTTAGIAPAAANNETDGQIYRAIITFVRAEFGIENPDREKYLTSFELIKKRLALARDYTEV